MTDIPAWVWVVLFVLRVGDAGVGAAHEATVYQKPATGTGD